MLGKISIPSSFMDVTIKQFMEYKAAKNEWEKVMALSGSPQRLVLKIKMSELTRLANICDLVMEDEKHTFKERFTLEGIDFGFEPNLSKIQGGAYADLATFCNPESIDQNLHKIMAVLYRPITKVFGKHYDIEAYDSSKHLRHAEFMLTQKACILGGVLDFFTVLNRNLKVTTLRSLEDSLEKTKTEILKMKARSEKKK